MFKVYKVLIHLTSENDFKIARGTEEAFKKKKNTIQMVNGYTKRCSTSQESGKCKSELQRSITSYLLESQLLKDKG